jgi:hypothetical protein
VFSVFDLRSRSDCDSKKAGWLDHSGFEADLVCLDFPVRQKKFAVPDHREFDTTTSETLGNFGLDSLSDARNQRNSLYFPCSTGIEAGETSSLQTGSTAIQSGCAETLPGG